MGEKKIDFKEELIFFLLSLCKTFLSKKKKILWSWVSKSPYSLSSKAYVFHISCKKKIGGSWIILGFFFFFEGPYYNCVFCNWGYFTVNKIWYCICWIRFLFWSLPNIKIPIIPLPILFTWYYNLCFNLDTSEMVNR